MAKSIAPKSLRAWTRTQLIACIVSAALLLTLFIFPSARLQALSADITASADSIENYALQEKWGEATSESVAMLHRFQRDQALLRFVLDHEDTDTLELHITSAIKLAGAGEIGQLLCELESVKNSVNYIANIEKASFESIL